jgi:hypothetical protein
MDFPGFGGYLALFAACHELEVEFGVGHIREVDYKDSG